MNIGATIAPNSEQLNADDLITGPRDIIIREVRIHGAGKDDQPVSVFFEGDEGKPFKPCKTMRRVMVQIWGGDEKQYVGRGMRLYRDPKITFGSAQVGGVRISHMTHLKQRMTLPVTVSKGRRAPYVVEPMDLPTGGPATNNTSQDTSLTDAARAEAAKGTAALKAHIDSLTDDQWGIVGAIKADLAKVAREADAATASNRDLDDTAGPTPEQIAAAQREAQEYAEQQAKEAGAE